MWSKANFLAALKQTQWVSQDQENKMKRDMKVLLVTSPPTEVQKGGHGDDTVYITLYVDQS